MSVSQDLGRRAEQAAADHLRAAGWTVLATNWRFGHKEIDVIARRDGVIAFVEVKCRTGSRFGTPAEGVTAAKRRDLAVAARAWIARVPASAAIYRFDVCAAVPTSGGAFHIAHIEDAWRL